MQQTELNKMLEKLYEVEQEATVETDKQEQTHGEFSKPHSRWLDIRMALRNAIEEITK